MRYYFYVPLLLVFFTKVSSAALLYYEQQFAAKKTLYHGQTELSLSPDGEFCFTVPLLREMGIDENQLANLPVSEFGCIKASGLGQHDLTYAYDAQTQRVAVLAGNVAPLPTHIAVAQSQPLANTQDTNDLHTNDSQSKTNTVHSDHVNDDIKWDDGINAAFINYNLAYNYYGGDNYQDEVSRHSLFAEMQYGINLGAWRLRYEQTYQKDTDGEVNWHTQNAYIARDIKKYRAQLKLGDSATASDIFESVPFRGVFIGSDDRMLPDHLRPFSPKIRGIAETNAEIRIWQNGIVIYHTFVPPGPFELKDVYPAAQDGNLYITIKESNGVEKMRLLPYSSMPNLAHSNTMKFSFTAGHYRSYYYLHDQDNPKFAQATLTYGLPNRLTVYTGMIASPIYKSLAVGVGRSIGQLGALSLDYRYSRANQPRFKEDDEGSVYRLRHVKTFFDYGITVSTLGEHYPRQNFRSFSEAVQQQRIDWWDLDDEGNFVGLQPLQKRYRLETRVNQYVNNTDSVYFTASRQSYYQPNNRTKSFHFGYSGNYKFFDYNVDYSYYQYAANDPDRRFNLSMTVPLSRLALPRMRLRMQHNDNFRNQRNQSVTLTGTTLTNYNLGYGVTVGKGNTRGTFVDTNMNYDHNAGSFSAWYSQGKGYRELNLNASGSAILHAGGVTLGQELGETNALVYQPNSPAVGLDNQFGVTMNKQGYAVATDLTAYRKNSLTLDEYSLDYGFYLPISSKDVVPTQGAIVFETFPQVESEEEEKEEPDDSDEENEKEESDDADEEEVDTEQTEILLGFVTMPKIAFLQ